MAGRTLIAGYERDGGSFGSVRVAAVSVTTWNPIATGVRSGFFIKARGSKKAYGVIARSVSLTRKVGGPEPYSGGTVNARVPIFQKAIWAALATGQIVEYAGKTDWEVAGTNAEESK